VPYAPPPAPSWLPPPAAAPQAPPRAPPPPNPRVRELTEELARAKVSHAAAVDAMQGSLRAAQAELAQLRALYAQQQQRLCA
jgi:hypothetical protein